MLKIVVSFHRSYVHQASPPVIVVSDFVLGCFFLLEKVRRASLGVGLGGSSEGRECSHGEASCHYGIASHGDMGSLVLLGGSRHGRRRSSGGASNWNPAIVLGAEAAC